MGGTKKKSEFLENFSHQATRATGTSYAFLVAVAVIVIWAITGPLFGFSDTWQLVINTGTTIVTFWMVFLIQRAQNNDSRALHMKLDEIIAALKGASNRLIKVEELTEPELDELQKHFEELRAKLAGEECGGGWDGVEGSLAHVEHGATPGRGGRKPYRRPHHPDADPRHARPAGRAERAFHDGAAVGC